MKRAHRFCTLGCSDVLLRESCWNIEIRLLSRKPALCYHRAKRRYKKNSITLLHCAMLLHAVAKVVL
ncbi:hypothetical protein NDU88_004026 [Pleurodeles waltl]|uniref:Uncharacterized protein n=1 Tax=Pleurodeles waltl TaxID=8319 RepID=A0AAV7M701_PLEWA|nr:hypothetical protein NDU88_004026 [Pleurodeles waltl]